MATSFDTIFDAFLSRIDDVEFASLNYEDQMADLMQWLDSALAYITTSDLSLGSDYEARDNTRMEFEDDLTRTEIQVIAMYMMVPYLDRKINALEHMQSVFASNSEKWTDQNRHMQQLMEARMYWLVEARKLFRNKSTRTNSYLGGNT